MVESGHANLHVLVTELLRVLPKAAVSQVAVLVNVLAGGPSPHACNIQ